MCENAFSLFQGLVCFSAHHRFLFRRALFGHLSAVTRFRNGGFSQSHQGFGVSAAKKNEPFYVLKKAIKVNSQFLLEVALISVRVLSVFLCSFPRMTPHTSSRCNER